MTAQLTPLDGRPSAVELAPAVLVERHHELALLRATFADCVAGSGRIALVTGAVACGRTELLAAFTEHAVEHGALLLTATATRAERSVPLGVAQQLLGNTPSAGSLLALATDRPVVVAVDDLHFADDESLELLRHTRCRLHSVRLMLVLTEWERPGLARPDVRAELTRQPHRRVVLGPLSPAGVSELLARRLGQSTADHLAPACHALSGGNPLLTHAVVDDHSRRNPAGLTFRDPTGPAHAAGPAYSTSPAFRGTAKPTFAAGPTFREAVLDALRRWDPALHTVATALAVLDSHSTDPADGSDGTIAGRLTGSPTDTPGRQLAGDPGRQLVNSHDLLDALVGPLPFPLSQAHAMLVAAGLVEHGRLRHPALAAAVLDSVPPRDLAHLHARAATLLHHHGADPTTVANHLTAANTQHIGGSGASSARRLDMITRTVDQRCTDATCFDTSGDHGEAVQRPPAEPWPGDPQRLDMITRTVDQRCTNATGLDTSGDHGEATPGLPAESCAGDHGAAAGARTGSWAVVALRHAAELALGTDPARAVRYLDLALRMASDDRDRLAMVRAAWRANPALVGRHVAATRTAPTTWRDAAGLARYELWQGDPETAANHLRALPTAPGSTMPGATAAELRMAAEWIYGRLPGVLRPWLGGATGDTPEHVLQRCPGDVPPEAAAAAILALGPGPRADRWCAVLGRETERRGDVTWRAVLGCVRADLAWRVDDPAAAQAEATTAWHLLNEQAWGVLAGLPLALLVDANTALNQHDAAAALLDRPVPPAMFDTAFGPRYLLARGRHHEACGRPLAAGDDFARCRAAGLNVPPNNLPPNDVPPNYLPTDNVPPDDVPPHGREGPVLSDAERRVATLAAGGHSNREIGRRLFITVSTVEQHLTRVYRKLNVSGRADLPGDLHSRTEDEGGSS